MPPTGGGLRLGLEKVGVASEVIIGSHIVEWADPKALSCLKWAKRKEETQVSDEDGGWNLSAGIFWAHFVVHIVCVYRSIL
jgi:hypothetical protein